MLPITLVPLIVLQAPVDGELARIVRAHETALNSIHSVETEIEVYQLLQYDATQKSASPLQTPRAIGRWYWAKQTPYERLRYHDHPHEDGDAVLNWDEMTSRILLNWDPNNPAPLTLTNQGRVQAIIARGSGMRSHGSGAFPEPAAMLLMAYHLATYDPELTLSRVISESSDVTWRREAGQYVVRARAQPTQRAPQGGELELYIDPAARYMVRRVSMVTPRYRTVREVIGFREYPNGVAFPERVRQEVFIPSVAAATGGYDIVCQKLRVNERLTPDTFELVFPQNALVREHDETGKFVNYKLWGNNNSPQRTFADLEEVNAYAGVGVEGSNPRRWLWTGACAAMLTLLVACVLRRRYKNRRHTG